MLVPRSLHLAAPFVIAAVLCTSAATAVAAEPSQTPADAGFQRMKLGEFTIIALADGEFPLPTDQLLNENQPGQVERLLRHAGLPTAVPTAINAFLIDTGARQVLVDAGSGALLGLGLGKLQENLRAAGYAPEQIDEVLLTHLHPDHFGGLSADGRMRFANAVIRIDRREADFWLDKSNASGVDDSVKGSFDGAPASLQPYLAAGRLETFQPGATLEPGITAVDLSGHTAGHTAYRVESHGQTLLLWGDIVHVAAVQLPAPKVTIHFDSTPTAAQSTREKVYAEAARQGYWVAAAHIAFPGIGHVEADGKGYSWKPAGEVGN